MLFKTNWLRHLHNLRKMEIEKILDFLGNEKFESGLEVGSGDGFQTFLLSKNFKKFFSTDLNFDRIKIKVSNVTYVKLDADNFEEAFMEEQFDIIFSSSFLEHLKDPIGFLKNSRVFLKKDGYAVHVVPTTFMKISYLLMFYPNLIILMTDRFWGLFKNEKIFRGEGIRLENNLNKLNTRTVSFFGKFKKIFLPQIHGMYKSHLEEFIKWRKKEWENMFEKTGYKVVKEIKGTVQSGYGFGFDFFRKIFEKLGFCSTIIFILKKHE